jgi:hypothetical protein
MRVNDNDPAKKVLTSQPGGSRPRGRPKLRWQDQVAEDAARAGCRKWKTTTDNREDWRKFLKEAKAHSGL